MNARHWKREWNDEAQAEFLNLQESIASYWVPVDEIRKGDISWIGQIADKTWATDEILGEFVRHFHSICNLHTATQRPI